MSFTINGNSDKKILVVFSEPFLLQDAMISHLDGPTPYIVSKFLWICFSHIPPQKTQNHSFSLEAGPFRAFFAGLLKKFLGFNFSFRFASAEASASLSGVSVRTAQCRFFFPLDLAFLGGAAGRGAKDSGLKSEDVEATGAIEEADKLSTEPSVAPRAVAKVDVNERTQEFTKAAARLLT